MTDVVVVNSEPTTLVVEPIENNTIVSPNVTNLEVNPTVTAIIAEPITQNVTIAAPGPQGVAGPPGPQGVPGPKGDSNVFYTHTQGLPSNTWVIQHNLDGYPTVVVFDSANSQCEGTISYQNNNQMTLTFTAAFSGTAYVI